MRAVIQNVSRASVAVDGKIINHIGKGLLIYLGIHQTDTEVEAHQMALKLIKLRIFEDHQHKLNLSVQDIKGSILIISQFTLYGDTQKGNRPSFTKAMEPERAKALYNIVMEELKKSVPTFGGVFQAHMDVESVNNGPVTVIHDINGV